MILFSCLVLLKVEAQKSSSNIMQKIPTPPNYKIHGEDLLETTLHKISHWEIHTGMSLVDLKNHFPKATLVPVNSLIDFSDSWNNEIESYMIMLRQELESDEAFAARKIYNKDNPFPLSINWRSWKLMIFVHKKQQTVHQFYILTQP